MNVSFFQNKIKKDMRGSSTNVRHAEPVVVNVYDLSPSNEYLIHVGLEVQ